MSHSSIHSSIMTAIDYYVAHHNDISYPVDLIRYVKDHIIDIAKLKMTEDSTDIILMDNISYMKIYLARKDGIYYKVGICNDGSVKVNQI